MTAASTARGRHHRGGSSRTGAVTARSAPRSATSIPTSASTATPARAAFSGEIVVWNRVSAVSTSSTPAGRSVKAPATSGRTSPSRASTGAPSTSTVVRPGSETTASAQSPAGRGTTPRSTPALATRSPSPVAVRRRPCSGSAAGSGRGGTVESSSRSPAPRAAAQLVVAVSATGWYGMSGIAAAPSVAVQEYRTSGCPTGANGKAIAARAATSPNTRTSSGPRAMREYPRGGPGRSRSRGSSGSGGVTDRAGESTASP